MRTIALLLGIAAAHLAQCASLSGVVGYTVMAVTDAKGTFDGADYGKLIALDNGWIFEFREYGYSYAYRPEVVVFGKGGQYKLLIERTLYDAAPVRQSSSAPVTAGPSSVLDLIVRGGSLGVSQDNAAQAAEIARIQAETARIEAETAQLRATGNQSAILSESGPTIGVSYASLKRSRSKHADFDAAIGSKDFNPTPTMQREMRSSREATELAYWLATHLDECRRIAALPSGGQALELKKIEAKLQ